MGAREGGDCENPLLYFPDLCLWLESNGDSVEQGALFIPAWGQEAIKMWRLGRSTLLSPASCKGNNRSLGGGQCKTNVSILQNCEDAERNLELRTLA